MRNLLTALCFLFVLSGNAQTLFSYGTHQVSKAEFWRAFTKNNTGPVTEKAIREYLDLYIRFKLKVQAAKDAKLDTLPNLTNDVVGFRAQLIDQYLRQQGSNKDLVTEAIERSKEELEIAHVFVAFEKDSAAAKTQIEKAYKELQNGADFGKTAAAYSNNSIVKNSNGYIGYITVFSLPYELENVVYGLKPGTYFKPVQGAKGWHIFKLMNKRPSLGKMKAAQILIGLPADADAAEKERAKKLADSVYTLVSSGTMKFEDAARMFSTDKFSYANGGEMMEFTYSNYNPAFSNVVFALEKDNDLSKPFPSAMGWHIVKRMKRTDIKTDINDAQVWDEWSGKVNADPRISIALAKAKEEMKKQCGYKPLPYNAEQLWTLTDTMLKAKDYVSFFKANRQKPLFQLTGKTISVTDWLQYAKSQPGLNAANGRSSYASLMKQFTDATVEQYYKDRMEQMNDEFKYQVKEFTEGSLLFEMMERTIWSKAPADSTGLLKYYNANKSKYKWQPSVSAVLFNCADTAVANEALRQMKANPADWKQIMDNLGGRALADSGRFEYNQLPVAPGTELKPGMFTAVETNVNDGSSSFCYIIQQFPGDDQRSFEEAKGLVINDYQLLLEEQWINQLKKKYPVKVNEAVVKGLK
ncbi:MAG: peptidylprolyl isomerase [Chitinophagaceae bacterium]|nr:peptidylprolyl isomerase [Chitinophagaceae bacterium]